MTKEDLRKELDAVIEEAREKGMVFALPNGVWTPDEAECLWPLDGDDDYETFIADLRGAMCEEAK